MTEMPKVNIARLRRLSAADQIKILDAAELEVTEVQDRSVKPDPDWVAHRRRRLAEVRRRLGLCVSHV